MVTAVHLFRIPDSGRLCSNQRLSHTSDTGMPSSQPAMAGLLKSCLFVRTPIFVWYSSPSMVGGMLDKLKA